MRVEPPKVPQAAPPPHAPERLQPGGRRFADWLEAKESQSDIAAAAASPAQYEYQQHVFSFAALGVFGRRSASSPALERSITPSDTDDRTAPRPSTLAARALAAVAQGVETGGSKPGGLPGDLRADGQSVSESNQSASPRISSPPYGANARSTDGGVDFAAPEAKGSSSTDVRVAVIKPVAAAALADGAPGTEAVIAEVPPHVPLRAPVQSNSPFNLTLYEQRGSVALSALAPQMSAEERSRLRQLCSALVRQFGLRVHSFTLNGAPLAPVTTSTGDE